MDKMDQLDNLIGELKKRGLWERNYFWVWSMGLDDAIHFCQDVLAGVNHTIGFERYIPLALEQEGSDVKQSEKKRM